MDHGPRRGTRRPPLYLPSRIPLPKVARVSRAARTAWRIMSFVVGIDLGTTNSLIAHLEGERPQIIPNRTGARMTPSVVGLDRQDRLHVGQTARTQLLAMPERTVAEVKRLMGSPERVTLGPRSYSPTEISALILRSLVEDAEHGLGRKVDEAVITVPAYFTDAQRQATKDAGELAGLKVERILNEPTAAALAYGLDHLDKEQFVLVYDLGGGTFDVSVLEMFEGVLDVKASSGNNHLGGSDFDRVIVDFLCREFEREHGFSLKDDRKAMTRLKAAAEQAKIELSGLETTQVLVPYLAQKGGEALSLEVELPRARFESLILGLAKSTLDPVGSALRDAGIDKQSIAEVVMVGGASRVPLVRRLVAEYFGKAPRRQGVLEVRVVAAGRPRHTALRPAELRGRERDPRPLRAPQSGQPGGASLSREGHPRPRHPSRAQPAVAGLARRGKPVSNPAARPLGREPLGPDRRGRPRRVDRVHLLRHPTGLGGPELRLRVALHRGVLPGPRGQPRRGLRRGHGGGAPPPHHPSPLPPPDHVSSAQGVAAREPRLGEPHAPFHERRLHPHPGRREVRPHDVHDVHSQRGLRQELGRLPPRDPAPAPRPAPPRLPGGRAQRRSPPPEAPAAAEGPAGGSGSVPTAGFRSGPGSASSSSWPRFPGTPDSWTKATSARPAASAPRRPTAPT